MWGQATISAGTLLYLLDAPHCFPRHTPDTPVSPLTAPPTNTAISVSPGEEVVEGQEVTITCRSDGAPPPTLVLRLESEELHRSSSTLLSLNVTPVLLNDSSHFYCEASNQYGSQQVSRAITVRGTTSLPVSE